MSKTRAKKTSKPRHAETSSFALSLWWVAAEALVFPAAMLMIVFFALARFANMGSLEAEAVIVAGFVVLRLPGVLYTMLRDRRVVLGKDALRVPVVGALQLRPWTIPFEDLAGIEETRKGGSSRIVVTLRGGGRRRFASSVLRDRAQAIKEIERRAEAARAHA